MSENNNDFLRWEVKPVWKVLFKSQIVGGTDVGTHSFEVLGLNRSAGDISRNWEKIHSVEQFNQGRAAKPGDYTITLAIKDFPSDSDTQTSLSPFTITSSTTKVDTRARGRYANIKIENTGVGESWRFGTFQVDLQPDGRRG